MAGHHHDRPDLDQRKAQLPLLITGTLPNSGPLIPYEARLQMKNFIGPSHARLQSGTLPNGYTISVDEATQEIVIAWPAWEPVAQPVFNGNFEMGDIGWQKGAGWQVNYQPADVRITGNWAGVFRGTGQSPILCEPQPCSPGAGFPFSAVFDQGPSNKKNVDCYAVVVFYDISGQPIGPPVLGNKVHDQSNTTRHTSSGNATPPAGTAKASTGALVVRRKYDRPVSVDDVQWGLSGAGVGAEEDAVYPITIVGIDSTGRSATWSGTVTLASLVPFTVIVNGPDATLNFGSTSRSVLGGGWDEKIDSEQLDNDAYLVSAGSIRVLALQGNRLSFTDNLGALWAQYVAGNLFRAVSHTVGTTIFLSDGASLLRSVDNGSSLSVAVAGAFNTITSAGSVVMAVDDNSQPYYGTAGGSFAPFGPDFGGYPETFIPVQCAAPVDPDGINLVIGGTRWGGEFGVSAYIPAIGVSANGGALWRFPTVGPRSGSEARIIGIAHNNAGRFIAVGSAGKTYYSDDPNLTSWTAGGVIPGWSGDMNTLQIRFTGEVFVALAKRGGLAVFASSPDGLIWTAVTQPFGAQISSFALIKP